MPHASCNHEIPPALREKLTDWRTLPDTSRDRCPICLVRFHITEMREIQAGLQDRGGIFEAVETWRIPIKGMKHYDWTAKWIAAKLRFQRELELLQEFREEDPETADACGLYTALMVWECEGEGTADVPGMKYVEKEKKDEKKDRKGKEIEKFTEVAIAEEKELSAQEISELWADERAWNVKPMRRSRRRRVVIEEKPVVEDRVRSLTGSSPDEGSTPDENVLKEMESITTRLDQGLNIGNWNIFDAIAGIEMSALTKPKVAIAPPTLSPQTLPPTEVVLKPTTPITPLRSALKGNRPASSPSPEAKTKPYSSFCEFATILSSTTPPTSVPHNQYTLAELARRQAFHRPSPEYQRSTWASPDGFQKLETSWYKLSFEALDEDDDDGEEFTFEFTEGIELIEGVEEDDFASKQLMFEHEHQDHELHVALPPKQVEADIFPEPQDPSPSADGGFTNFRSEAGRDNSVVLDAPTRPKPRTANTHRRKYKYKSKTHRKASPEPSAKSEPDSTPIPEAEPEPHPTPVPYWLEITTTPPGSGSVSRMPEPVSTPEVDEDSISDDDPNTVPYWLELSTTTPGSASAILKVEPGLINGVAERESER
jgi:hypothetical protein